MLRMISKALLALALSAGPLAAQSFTLPEIGLQNTGSCRQLAARDRSNNAMVALGCLDTAKHSWRLTPDSIQIQGTDSTGDVSKMSVTPQASAQNGSLAQLLASVAPVALTFADKTGQTAINSYLVAAISTASSLGITELRLPAGSFMIDTNIGGVTMPSNLRIRGAGQGKTTIICNDAVVQTVSCFTTADGSTNVHLSDMTVKGLGDSGHFSAAAAPVRFIGCTDCSVDHVEVRYARFISIFATNCNRFSATDNFIYRSMLDGIHVTDTPNAIISRNIINGVNDDAIAAHTYDTTAAPVRSGLIIADNLITESQGIRALGMKAGRISGNVLQRIMSFGVIVDAEPNFGQGNTPNFAIEIGNNVITDVFIRQEPNPRSTFGAYMKLGGGPRKAASAGSGVPGWPNSSGAIVSPFGYYYQNNTVASGVASPGGGYFNIHDNILVRTLPPVTSYALWGYDPSLYVGNNGDGTGFYSGAIPEVALNVPALLIDGPLYDSRIANNIVRTTGGYGIQITPSLGYPGGTTPPPIADFDYDGLTISGNKFKDVLSACVSLNTASRTNQRISLIDNECDGDPRFISTGRGSGGTWSNQNVLFGIYAPLLASTGVMRGNTFRNVGTPLFMNAPGGILKINNVVYAHGSAGYSASNTGIGNIPAASNAWSLVDEDGNPASPTFGLFLATPTP